MTPLDEALDRIAAERRLDPMAPVTVIVPSRVAALQLRRRLAQRGPFAVVRFEPVSRIAELIAAADLAREGRRPLARPIADYAARLVALESQGQLAGVAELAGYARALRQTFRRMRHGGYGRADDLPPLALSGQLPEISRLFGRFRALTAAFYDEEDLLETAAARLRADPQRVLPELGEVYVVPPARASAAEAVFLDAVRAAVEPDRSYEEIEETAATPDERFILAPDAASEARAVVREVIAALQAGMRQDEIAVFYSGDRAYRGLLEQAFAAAAIPVAAMPGTPLIELAAGRGVLALARLPLADYGRVALFDFLSLAPLRPSVRIDGGDVPVRASQWQRVAREAGVTHGKERWREALDLFEEECRAALMPESDVSEARRTMVESSLAAASELREFMGALIERLEPLGLRQPASRFIETFGRLLRDLLVDGAEGLSEVQAEVEQLGTIDAIGGELDLESFAEALEANLRAAYLRRTSFGGGVLVADYRLAAGLRFRRAFICGAYEGAFPAAPESEPLLQDEVWSSLRVGHPYIDDLALRLRLAHEAAERLLTLAEGGVLTWSCPLQAPNATRDYYPAAPMVAAVRRRDPAIGSASALRRAGARDWIVRLASPLAGLLTGPALDRWEGRLRETVLARRDNRPLPAAHPLRRPLALLRGRRSGRFTEFDGNLTALQGHTALPAGTQLSPTGLENYAVCGLRYFLRSVLRLRGIEEPDETDTIGPAEKGTLVHQTLQRFFSEQQQLGRPRPNERWSAADSARLLAVFEEEFERLRHLGGAGLDVFADFDRRVLRADLEAFLEQDGDFRAGTGAVPAAFELRLQPVPLDDVTLSGFVDRIDRTPDGRRAFVIDYKTGSSRSFQSAGPDPFAGGTRLQLPVYVLAAADVEEVQAIYWFVTRREDFKQVSYDETPANRERFESTVRAILHGVRTGAYPAVPGDEDDYYGGFENCKYCDFDRLCSRRRLYEEQDKRADPALAPWHRVAETARGGTPQ